MQNTDVTVENISTEYGDARFSLYRVRGNEAENYDTLPILHHHSYYELHLVKKGAYTFWEKEGQVTVTENKLLLIKPKYEHYSFLKEGENSESTVISLSVQKIEGEPHIYDLFCKNAEMLNMNPKQLPKILEDTAERFCKSDRTSIKGELLAKLLADEFVYCLLDLVIPEGEDEKEASKDLTKNNMEIVLESIVDTNNTLSEISEKLGYSERQTARLIKKTFGMTFTKLHKYRNLENAKKLLQNMPDLSISTVAIMSGFKNESIFYKTFKKETGLTPGEYRRRYNG